MYTIKQAAARAGVSVPLLRAWERRYGVVSPQRTAAGYRLYDDEAIARLTAMRGLLDDGWTASNAAAEVLRMDVVAIRSLTERAGGATGVGTDGPINDDLIRRFVAAAKTLDSASMERILDEAFTRSTFETAADATLMPMLVAVGDAWASGAIDIASEHGAANAMLRRLSTAFESTGRALRDEQPVLVGLPPGSRHELGALAFAVAARRAALPVVYLGADLPAFDWVAAAQKTRARAAVIGVVTRPDAGAVQPVVAALRAARPDLVIALGGKAAGGVQMDGVLHLPDRLVAAVDQLRAALA